MQDFDIGINSREEGYYVEIGAGCSAVVTDEGGFAVIDGLGGSVSVRSGILTGQTVLTAFSSAFSSAFR